MHAERSVKRYANVIPSFFSLLIIISVTKVVLYVLLPSYCCLRTMIMWQSSSRVAIIRLINANSLLFSPVSGAAEHAALVLGTSPPRSDSL